MSGLRRGSDDSFGIKLDDPEIPQAALAVSFHSSVCVLFILSK